MIGWYVHHHGLGHLHRARAVISATDLPVTVLSSLPRPRDWDLPWVTLERDDNGWPAHPDAGGHLHWAPLHDAGLRSRMAAMSSWMGAVQPDLMVCDVSVEVAVLSRLHGVPVVCVAMPGDRSDPAHRLGYGIATELVGCWPEEATDMVRGLSVGDAERLRLVGALSRFPVTGHRRRRPGPPRVSVLIGAGGSEVTTELLEEARSQAPTWQWTLLGSPSGAWEEQPFRHLCDADVVVTHAGQNALAEVAAARRPAVVVPACRPHDEQQASSRSLSLGSWPVIVRPSWSIDDWGKLLNQAWALDGAAWATWCDGGAARRFADILEATVAATHHGAA